MPGPEGPLPPWTGEACPEGPQPPGTARFLRTRGCFAPPPPWTAPAPTGPVPIQRGPIPPGQSRPREARDLFLQGGDVAGVHPQLLRLEHPSHDLPAPGLREPVHELESLKSGNEKKKITGFSCRATSRRTREQDPFSATSCSQDGPAGPQVQGFSGECPLP